MGDNIFKYSFDKLFVHIAYIGMIVLIFIGVATGGIKASSEDVKYDVNNDGKITAQDYVEIKNYIMDSE